MLHLRLAEPVDELVNHVPLRTRTEHAGKARQQLREWGYLHDGIASGPLRLGIDRAVPLGATGC
jgi:hypothetical protein